ncbi:MurR/RpiR family transcriptional regulator [Carbonactinospora thermoautotrophica]|nr:MurR/RpiR family transcriptional regulator [Carbonactinospora thermoautotrophica]
MRSGDQVTRQRTPTERLLALFDGHRLSPTQRRIAQYLLDHLPEAAFLSSVDLAERAGVSQPSVTRFAVALGFSGYPALREALRPIALSAAADSPDTPEEIRRNELQAAVAAEIRNLESLHRMLANPTQVLDLGRRLAASVPLTVLGLRISAPLAEYFAYAAKRIHPDVRCVTAGGSAVYDALLQAQTAGGTWLLAFAMPRYAAETVQALRFARELGLKSAVVTDVPFVPFARDVDMVLPVGVGSRLVFDSYAAPVVLAAVVLQAMADAAPERTQTCLEAYEQVAEREDFFYGR